MMDALIFEKKPTSVPKKFALDRAIDYLVGRLRLRTPLGATEFLQLRSRTKPGFLNSWSERVEIARTVCEMYRDLFPREYAASGTPAYSTQREREFYHLIEQRLFPLMLDEFKDDPEFYLPFIPVRGIQKHNWATGDYEFEDLETIYQLALVLSGMTEPRKWLTLGLAKAPSPEVGSDPDKWDRFVAMCAKMEGTPVIDFPLSFYLINYKTGCVWLDIPPFGGYIAYEWSREDLGKLFIAKQQADEISQRLLVLNAWLDEDRALRLRCIAEMWKLAAANEGSKHEQRTIQTRL